MEQSTVGVWAGEEIEGGDGSAHLSVVHRIAFDYPSLEEWRDVALGRRSGHIYSRNTNPTVAIFEEKVRQLEGAEAATSFSSGMAAISNTLSCLLRPGDTIISLTDTYGGTHQLFRKFLPPLGIKVGLYDPSDCESIERAVQRGCQVLYLETPTNPTLKVVDVAKLASVAHAAGAVVITDNTVATPINQKPLDLGSDLVIHSASKFLGGHGDALGGAVCGRRELVARIFRYREINGAALCPFAAFLLARGMKTLELRVVRHNENALAIAQFLQSHPQVSAVYYPGLPSHPDSAVARKQMRGYGGMLSFTLNCNESSVGRFLRHLRLARRAASLGHVETVVGIPATTSHVECTAEERAAMGIPENLIRYSVGIENQSDLIADLARALDALGDERSGSQTAIFGASTSGFEADAGDERRCEIGILPLRATLEDS